MLGAFPSPVAWIIISPFLSTICPKTVTSAPISIDPSLIIPSTAFNDEAKLKNLMN